MGDLSSSCKCLRTAAVFKFSFVFTTFEGHVNFDDSFKSEETV